MDAHIARSPPALAPPITVDPTNSSTRPSPPRPSTRTELRERRDSSWREEQASLQHQLRLAKAEIASLQGKLGIKANHVPFNSTSPRQGSPLTHDPHPAGPSRKTSFSDLSAPTSSANARRRSSSNASATSPRMSHFPHHAGGPGTPHTPGRLPEGVGAVAMNRALLSHEGSPGSSGANGHDNGQEVETLLVPGPAPFAPGRAPSPSGVLSNGLPSVTSAGARSPSTASNPFFGSSGASRERLSKSAASAQSGSGRVISGLQSDLLQARTALESTRGQLRLSQHDLKETKERLTGEIEQLNRQIARKERLQDEALVRARTAEGALTALQKEHADLERSVKGKMKELEEGAKRAEDAKVRSEREYAGLRDGLRTMQEGWKEDLRWIREDLARSQKELENKSATISTLLTSRASLSSTVDTSLSSIRATHAIFTEQHTQSTSVALKELSLLSTRSEADARRTEELKGEFGRLKRAMVDYQTEGIHDEGDAYGASRPVELGLATGT